MVKIPLILSKHHQNDQDGDNTIQWYTVGDQWLLIRWPTMEGTTECYTYQMYCFIYSSLYWIRPRMLQCCKFLHIPTSNKRVGHHFHAVVSNKILIIILTTMALIIEKNYDQQKLISRFTGSFAVCLRARRVRNYEVVCIDGVFYAYRLRLYKLNHITRINHALYASNQRTIYLMYIRTILFYLDYKNNSCDAYILILLGRFHKLT